ncbi:MAG: N-acetyltransferase [bacterium]|nr:N-acetyltransferase [bacterium]
MRRSPEFPESVPTPPSPAEPRLASLAVRAEPPAQVRIPSTGVPWRRLGADDVQLMLDLVHLCEDVDQTPYRTTLAEIEDLFDPAKPHAGYAGLAEDGSLVAFGFVRVATGPGGRIQAICSGSVHPEWRDRNIGSQIVNWQLDISRHLLADSGLEGPAQILHVADETLAGMQDILTRNGFEEQRAFTQMRRDLSLPLPEVELSQHLSIEPWSSLWSDQVRRAYNQALADAELGTSLDPEEWEKEFASLVPEWSFVAVDRASDRARVAGYIVGARYEDDWPMLGWREGYIDSFGVMADWRQRGIGRALLGAAMSAFRDAGMDYAGIDVDEGGDETSNNLYEAVGFEATYRSAVWVIDL